MRTIKFLSFVSACLLVLSSCEALADATAQEIKGTAPAIEFTTVAPLVQSPSKVAPPTDLGNIIYETNQSVSFIKDELSKKGLSMDNMENFNVTASELYLPIGTDLTPFRGVALYIDDILIAKESGAASTIIDASTFSVVLELKATSLLSSLKDDPSRTNVKITVRNPVVPPSNVLVTFKYHYTSTIKIKSSFLVTR